MRALPFFLLFTSAIFLSAQTAPADALPGMAGHPDCQSYFAVMWLDGTPEGQTRQATHYGLNQQQFDWWKQEGYQRNHNLCYVSKLLDDEGVLYIVCPNCGADWQKRFRWLVFEHNEAKSKRVGPSAADPGEVTHTPGQVRGRPALEQDSKELPGAYEVAVVATGVAVFAPDTPMRAPRGSDRQLFYRAAQKDRSKKDFESQIARNDRATLQAAIDFVAKDVKR